EARSVECISKPSVWFRFFFQAEDGIRDGHVTGVQTCALPISLANPLWGAPRIHGELLKLGSTSRSAPLPGSCRVGRSRPLRLGRSEERRVGKECRTRGAP